MTLITILTYVNLAIAAVSLMRLRPTLFILAGNQVLALRSLKTAWIEGRPENMGYISSWLYSQDSVERASYLFVISTIPMIVAALMRGSKGDRVNTPFPLLPPQVLRVVAGLLVFEALATKTILTTSHAEGLSLFNFNLGGLHALIVGMLLYELYARVELGLLSGPKAFLIIFAVSMFTGYLQGMTGFPTGTLVVALVMFAPRGLSPARTLRMGAILGLVLVVASVIRSSRDDLASGGVSVLTSHLGAVLDTPSEDPEAAANAGGSSNSAQTVAHILECMWLYDNDHSRSWKSIYLPILYTFEPAFIMGPLGFERPKEAAWELADYFIHGGGIDTLGETYWNGGYFCTAAVWAGLVLFIFYCDTRWRLSKLWLYMLCAFGPGLLMAYGYGFAQVSRGAFNGLLWLAFDRFFLAKRGKRTPRRLPGDTGQVASMPSIT